MGKINLNLFLWIKRREIGLIGIDSLINYYTYLDLVWMPTFKLNSQSDSEFTGKVLSGWDTLLIQKRLPTREWRSGNKVLVLTGGTDSTRLGNILPRIIDSVLRDDSVINWVQGPFSARPKIPSNSRLKWNLHNAPSQLDDLILESNYAKTVFGISFFELLQYGKPIVVFSPYGNKDDNELKSLSNENVAIVANNPEIAVERLVELMGNDPLAKEYSDNALKKMSNHGAKNLSNKIYSLMRSE